MKHLWEKIISAEQETVLFIIAAIGAACVAGLVLVYTSIM